MKTLELKDYNDEYGPATLGVLIGPKGKAGDLGVLHVLISKDVRVIRRAMDKFGEYTVQDKRVRV